jgi:hypothetical protein
MPRSPDGADVVEVIDRDLHHLPSHDLKGVGKLTGKHRLARTVNTVDADPNTVLAICGGHQVCHPSQEVLACGARLIAMGGRGRHMAILASLRIPSPRSGR